MTEEIREEAHILGGRVEGKTNLVSFFDGDVIVAIQPQTEAGCRQLERVVASICKVLPRPLYGSRSVPTASGYCPICRARIAYNNLIEKVPDLAQEPVDVVFLVLEDHGQSQEGS